MKATNKGTQGSDFHIALSWLYQIDDDFSIFVKEKHPMALVVVAHFTPLMSTLESYWFMEGWVKHTLSTIRSALNDEYLVWLEWLN